MPRERAKNARVTDDRFVSVIREFMRSPKWAQPAPTGYADNTKALWGAMLSLAAEPDALGDVPITDIRPKLVQAYLDGMSGKPGKQAATLSSLRQLERWAIVRDVLPRAITTGVETGKPTGGHKPWNDAQVATAEAHARPDIAKAITLASNTGQRCSDLVRMGPTDIETFQGPDGIRLNGINVTQQKTGRQVWVPITSALAAAMETWPRSPGPFLRNPAGHVWEPHNLSRTWTHQRETNPALVNLREDALGYPLLMHGLRATACVRLRRSGAEIPQIADMVGMSEAMVARYCRFSSQKENAVAAVLHLDATLRERSMGRKRDNRDESAG